MTGASNLLIFTVFACLQAFHSAKTYHRDLGAEAAKNNQNTLSIIMGMTVTTTGTDMIMSIPLGLGYTDIDSISCLSSMTMLTTKMAVRMTTSSSKHQHLPLNFGTLLAGLFEAS